MNDFLTMDDWHFPVSAWGICSETMSSRDFATGCIDAPGFGSGLTWDPCNKKVFEPLWCSCKLRDIFVHYTLLLCASV